MEGYYNQGIKQIISFRLAEGSSQASLNILSY